MILTAIKPVNIRLGKPSLNAPNPSFIRPGDRISVRSKVLGDSVDSNNIWILSEEEEFFSSQGFGLTEEFKALTPLDHLPTFPQLFNKLEIPELWHISKGEGINVGIIDSGVATHSSLKCKITELNQNVSMSKDLTGHGTTMACIINSFDEDKGKIGVAPMIENIFSYTIDIKKLQPIELVNAMDKMLKANVNILNLSFSTNESIFFKPHPDAIKIQDKINELVKNDCIIVCATGNTFGRGNDFYPAKYDNIISVSGFDAQGNVDIDSNIWNGVSVSMSSEHYFNDDQFQHSNGTSGATAVISGCIACVYNSIKGGNKTKIIQDVFSKMPPIATTFKQTKFSIPKFETTIFTRLLNS